MKVVSLCFEVCYPQRNALSPKKSKAKTGKIRHVSQDIRHLHEIPWGKGFWDTIRSSSGWSVSPKSPSFFQNLDLWLSSSFFKALDYEWVPLLFETVRSRSTTHQGMQNCLLPISQWVSKWMTISKRKEKLERKMYCQMWLMASL